ncbi:MAG TPA: acyltransferase [Stellaceae bacterium]|nr:acyltransferase [Stellaceae bacterium]
MVAPADGGTGVVVQTLARRGAGGGRIAALDGIRGWAALVVLLSHMFSETNRSLLPEMANGLTRLLLDGNLAVYIFFILSGEALSAHYVRTHDLAFVRVLAARRYFRLTIPILMASGLVFLLMATGFSFAHPAGIIINRPDWLGAFLQFEPSWPSFLDYTLHRVYTQVHADTDYVPFLWTMKIELRGSFVVFATLLLVNGLRPRQRIKVYAAAALAVLVFDRVLIGFICGLIFAELRAAGTMSQLRDRPSRWAMLILAIFAAAVTVSTMRAFELGTPVTSVAVSDLLTKLVLFKETHIEDFDFMNLYALLVMCLIFASRRLDRFFMSRLSKFLGRLSFPLYLVQFPVLISVTSGLIVRFVDPAHPDRAILYGIATLSVIVAIALAWAFARCERFLLRHANALVTRLVA